MRSVKVFAVKFSTFFLDWQFSCVSKNEDSSWTDQSFDAKLQVYWMLIAFCVVFSCFLNFCCENKFTIFSCIYLADNCGRNIISIHLVRSLFRLKAPSNIAVVRVTTFSENRQRTLSMQGMTGRTQARIRVQTLVWDSQKLLLNTIFPLWCHWSPPRMLTCILMS